MNNTTQNCFTLDLWGKCKEENTVELGGTKGDEGLQTQGTKNDGNVTIVLTLPLSRNNTK